MKSFEGVTDEWQAHLRNILARLVAIGSSSSFKMSGVIGLINLVRRKVSGVDVGSQLRFKWGTDTTKCVKLNTTEEFVGFDLICTSPAKAVLRVTNKAMSKISFETRLKSAEIIPSNEILSFRTKLNILGEVERLTPVDNLPISVVGILSTERRPANLTLKHDRSQRPPITIVGIAVAAEDLRCDIIRGTDCGIGHNSSRLSPIVDRTSIADREINLVKVHRISVPRSTRLALEELLVIGVVMEFVETS